MPHERTVDRRSRLQPALAVPAVRPIERDPFLRRHPGQPRHVGLQLAPQAAALGRGSVALQPAAHTCDHGGADDRETQVVQSLVDGPQVEEDVPFLPSCPRLAAGEPAVTQSKANLPLHVPEPKRRAPE